MGCSEYGPAELKKERTVGLVEEIKRTRRVAWVLITR